MPLPRGVRGVLVVGDPRRCAAAGPLASPVSWEASGPGGLLLGAALGIAGAALALGPRPAGRPGTRPGVPGPPGGGPA
ncbi:hypothetical protein ABT117_33560 [Streptomyces sp. NPDC002262]|uniref:hypothetical protein n=1 Tax=Streptomyces sp. NPDC002262 TaxID=3154414 RepID=UPI00332F76E8